MTTTAPKKKKKSNTILFVGVGIVVLTLGRRGRGLLRRPVRRRRTARPETGRAAAPKGGGSGQGTGRVAAARRARTSGRDRTARSGPNGGAGPDAGLSPSSRDATNLLPNDAQWVLDVDVQAVLGTPAGTAMFDPAKQTGTLVKDHFGVPVHQIERVVASGGGDGAWTFNVIQARTAFNIDAMKAAMELGDPLGEIKSRDYLPGQGQPRVQAVGNYFATKLKDMGFKLDPPAGPRELTVCSWTARPWPWPTGPRWRSS